MRAFDRDLWDRLEPRLDRVSGECWMWLGGSHGSGKRYGGVSVNGRMRYAHRVVYELFRGPVATGLELDHLCRNRWCCRPDHLEAVTHAENMRRGIRCTRTTCDSGHEGAYATTSSGRVCRICRREANVRYRRRLGGADRAEGMRRMLAARSPERRSEIARKIWETRRRNAAA